ncbi:ATP-binding cassette domain-containing protein [Streptomyces sp. NPDC127106]|uniref:ATP-binding cassette domain-containing protein n=1 Tax=Streptomyces sp. NPDC127106 TaxID=3345360 RepID=UPI0036389EC3
MRFTIETESDSYEDALRTVRAAYGKPQPEHKSCPPTRCSGPGISSGSGWTGIGGVHRWGLPLAPGPVRRRVDEILESVGATAYGDVPVGRLSSGEQQRLRIAQALASDPRILLCDEPLLSLDLQHQRIVTTLVDRRRRSAGTAVVFVLYLAPGGFRIGPPDEVMTTAALPDLYGTPTRPPFTITPTG